MYFSLGEGHKYVLMSRKAALGSLEYLRTYGSRHNVALTISIKRNVGDYEDVAALHGQNDPNFLLFRWCYAERSLMALTRSDHVTFYVSKVVVLLF